MILLWIVLRYLLARARLFVSTLFAKFWTYFSLFGVFTQSNPMSRPRCYSLQHLSVDLYSLSYIILVSTLFICIQLGNIIKPCKFM